MVFFSDVTEFPEFIDCGFPGAQTVENLSAVQETQVQSLGQEDPLEKVIATNSSILASKIPWPEEPGRLQSTRLPRVRHN